MKPISRDFIPGISRKFETLGNKMGAYLVLI
jgi:hypothetical protein